MKIVVWGALLALVLWGTNVSAADWQQDIADLQEEVQILKRRVSAKYDAGVSAEVNQLYGQAGKRGDDIRELNIRLEDLDHQMTTSGENFERINRDLEIRIKLLEDKEIPDELSAPVPNIAPTFEAPVALEAAREVVGDEIQGGDLAPIDDYSGEFGYQGEW